MASSQWKPSEGNYGIFGSAKGSKAGTLRRAQRAGTFRNVQTAGGETISGTGRDIKNARDIRGNFSNRWTAQQGVEIGDVRDTLTEGRNIGLEGTGLEDVLLPKSENLGDQLRTLENEREQAEMDKEMSFAEARQKEIDAIATEREGKMAYQADMAKVARDQASSLQAGSRQTMQAQAAGSQGGFAKSGAVERLREMGQSTQQTSLSNIAEQKKMITKGRDDALVKAEGLRSDAIQDRITAEKTYDDSIDAYDRAYSDLFNPYSTEGGLGGALQAVKSELKTIADTDLALQKEVRSAGSYGGDFWTSTASTQEYSGLKSQIESARESLKTFDVSTLQGGGGE